MCVERREELNTPPLRRGADGVGHPAVPGDTGGYSLLLDHPAGLVERKEERDRRGVGGLHRGALPALAVGRHVEVEGALLRDPVPGAVADGDRRKARGSREALLRPDDGDIDAPLIHPDIVAADGGDTVHDEERIVLPGEFRDLRSRVLDPGARLVVDHRDDLGPGLEFALESREVERGPPLGFESGDGAVTSTDLRKAVAELPVDKRDNLFVPCEVRDAGLHPGASGAADDVEFVCCTKEGL
ncbi:hypothetical protein DSECCO2_490040 [anaerobic digester metagenome]